MLKTVNLTGCVSTSSALNLKTNLEDQKKLRLKIQQVWIAKKSKKLSGTEMPKWNKKIVSFSYEKEPVL